MVNSECGFLISFERVVRKRNMPGETSSPKIIEIMRSEYVVLMSSERLVIPYEPLSSEIIEITRSRYGFLMSFARVMRSRNLFFKEICRIPGFSNHFNTNG